MAKYRIGSKVRISDEGKQNDSYIGWEDRRLKIVHVATRYGKYGEDGTHPGYDESAEGTGLYDMVDANTGEQVPFSLYDWEICR